MKKITLIILAVLLIINSGPLGKKINDHLSLEFSERFRFLSWDNTITLDESTASAQTFTRHRTSVGLIWHPVARFDFHLKLTNEFRYYFVPTDRSFNFNEIFIDQLYAKINKPFDLPLTLTVGRQNIILGEGFVMLDGGPLDGSRAMYFNAVRLDWSIDSRQKITAFYVNQKEHDRLLPIINDKDQYLIEQPEEGFGLYYSEKSYKHELHAYYIRKNADRSDLISYKSRINTIGTRVKYLIFNNLDFIIEGAYQFGKRNESDCLAWGGYSYLKFKPPWKTDRFYLPTFLITGLVYLSGNNPSTAKNEDWDPMFARWPKWSESYIYTQINEDRVAYWTNLISLYATVQFELGRDIHFRFDYHHLVADQKLGDDIAFPGGTGANRGDLFIGKLTYKFNQSWSGHILWESFIPGDYYFPSADYYTWLRTELMFKF